MDTSAPLSMLKWTGGLFSMRAIDQDSLFLLVLTSRKALSSSILLTVFDDFQKDAQWLLVEHLWQIASLAGQFCCAFPSDFPRFSQ